MSCNRPSRPIEEPAVLHADVESPAVVGRAHVAQQPRAFRTIQRQRVIGHGAVAWRARRGVSRLGWDLSHQVWADSTHARMSDIGNSPHTTSRC